MPDGGRPESIRRAVGEILPGAGRIDALRRVGIGWGNENWTADTQLGRVMIKIGLAESSAEKWRGAELALHLARTAGVSAPELLAFTESSAALDGRILRVFTYVEGQSPEMVVDDAALRSRFLHQLGEAVARLHHLAQPEFTSRVGQSQGCTQWSEFVTSRWRAVVARAERARLDRQLLTAADTALTELAGRFDQVAAPVLCHRDLYFDNLLCNRAGDLVAILDFDMAEAWEPAADFHKLRWWTFGADPASERAFLSGYGEPLPDDFDARVRLVEILDLVNGLANWVPQGPSVITVEADLRLRALLAR